jgi:hypothetical protein
MLLSSNLWVAVRSIQLQQEENMIKKGSKTVLHFAWMKDTPGTFVYHEVDENGEKRTPSQGASIPTIYVTRQSMPVKLTGFKIEITGE